MLIDVKKFAKDEKQCMSAAIKSVLGKYLPNHWIWLSQYHLKHVNNTKACYGDGFAMLKRKHYTKKHMRYKTPEYRLPVAKSETIILDTDSKLLIFDDLVAIDVS